MTHSEVTALITIDELLNEDRPSEEDLKQIEDHMADWKERIDIIRNKTFKWPGCDYQCSECGNIKFVITNTFMPEIWERCTDECMWNALGAGRGPALLSKEGEITGFHKRKFRIVE